MSKIKGSVLGANHVNYVGPKGAFIGSAEGRTPGVPAGYEGTVGNQYGRDVIDTSLRGGTPLNDRDGNVDEARRVVSQHRYGMSPVAGGIDLNDPAANGSGVVFDGAKASNGYMPNPGPTVDSPVPQNARYFDNRTVAQENKARLGQGDGGIPHDDVRKMGGVMSR
jgi:hypothetical protein